MMERRTADGTRAEPTVYRTRSQAFGLAFAAVTFLVLMVIGVARSKASLGGILAYSPIGLLSLLVLIRGAAAILVVDDRSVTVRNLVRTVSIPWVGITAFEVGRYKILGCVLIIRRTDRSVLPVFAVQGITGQPRRRTSVAALAAAEELNERLRRVTGRMGTDGQSYPSCSRDVSMPSIAGRGRS
jgi:hypothetical protein